ncbi:preprotein translocase subunit SecG [Peptoniphilus catoniae]|uniref:preprotein translocase subunit SecG n=1 Tax=Peptoniphilus catoniae TaxID=1660341 RepID=UPI0010FD29B0|nr:preprotein translocase subunit SecG [Peptoniphilus catoniae]
MKTILSVIIALSAIVMIVTVALTESKQAGLGTLSGEESSLWGEHRGTSKKEMQDRIVMVSSIVFVVAVLMLAIF